MLGYLSEDDIVTLETALCSAEGLGSRRITKSTSSISSYNSDGACTPPPPPHCAVPERTSITKSGKKASQASRVALPNISSSQLCCRHHKSGPAGFSSMNDLLHRLFVAISGVADRLQSNYATDLRSIMKQVFEIVLSEPSCDEDQEPVSPSTLSTTSASPSVFSDSVQGIY